MTTCIILGSGAVADYVEHNQDRVPNPTIVRIAAGGGLIGANGIRPNRLGPLLDALQRTGAKRVLFAGSNQRFLSSSIDPADDIMNAELAQIGSWVPNAYVFAVQNFLENKNGFEIVSLWEFFPELFISALVTLHLNQSLNEYDSCHVKLCLREAQQVDFRFVPQNFLLDRGRIVRHDSNTTDGFISSIEQERQAFEHPVLCKIAIEPFLRLSPPAVGPQTIELAFAAGIKGLIVEPGTVLILEKDRTVETARQRDFSIIALAPAISSD